MVTSVTTTITIRTSMDVRDLIDRAAEIQKKSLTDFMLEASCVAARQVLLDHVFFPMSEVQMTAFDRVMAAPISNNAAIRKLLATKSPWQA